MHGLYKPAEITSMKKAKLELTLPQTRAEICKKVLQVDKELKSIVSRDISVEGDVLVVEFCSTSLKQLRTSINAFLEATRLTLETIDEFQV